MRLSYKLAEIKLDNNKVQKFNGDIKKFQTVKYIQSHLGYRGSTESISNNIPHWEPKLSLE